MVETLDHSGNGKTLVKAWINSYLQLVVYREAGEYSSASFFCERWPENYPETLISV